MIYEFIWEVEDNELNKIEQKYLFNFYEISSIDYNIETQRELNSSPPPDYVDTNKKYELTISFTNKVETLFKANQNTNNITAIQNLYNDFKLFTP